MDMSSSPTSKTVIQGQSNTMREKWASKIEFLLALVGYAIDLGNVWRFPTVCYRHGGGAFLAPYLIMLVIGGLPIFYMELALGQFHKLGCLSVWQKVSPIFKGIGYGTCFVSSIVSLYYNTIIAHAIYFTFSSLKAELSWKTCNNSWNTELCTSNLNETLNKEGERLNTPSEEYFLYNVLEIQHSTGLDGLGGVKPLLAICLIIVFLLIYFAIWKGVKSVGKVVWVTSIAPYIILTVLLIRGITLPGASTGIYYYIIPDFEKLLDPNVWTAAAAQIFFSLGSGLGVIIALSSYNDFNNNCYRDALSTCAINCGTSFFAGFVIFSTLGYMSKLTKRPIHEVVSDQGANLIFAVYPQAIATMPFSNIWSFIFFSMLIFLGIDSTFSGIEAIITAFCDEYPKLLASHRKIFVAFVLFIYYVGSLPSITYGGSYVILFLDEYGVSLSLMFIVICETVAVFWFYGVERFSQDIHQMLGFSPGLYWRICWLCCPILMTSIFVLTASNISMEPLKTLNYVYPQWSIEVGWILRISSILPVPVFAIYFMSQLKGTIFQRWKQGIKPVHTADQQPTTIYLADQPFTHSPYSKKITSSDP